MNTLAWDRVATFLAVMRSGSLSGASRELGVAQPTARRQIEQLEEQLGVSLFTRSQAGLAPTEHALAALPYAESMAGVAEALVRSASASSREDAGTVRVTCSEVIGVEVVPPMLATLAAAHPRIHIELSATNANEDLLRRDADVAIRMVQPAQRALVAKKVASIEVGLFASERYLDAHGTPKTLDALSKHALVGRDRDPAFYALLGSMGLRVRRQDFALRTDSDTAQLGAIRAGLGIGVCQAPLAARSPKLVRVLPKLGVEMPAWVVTHEDLRASRRVAVVFDHLARSLAAYASR